MENLITSLAVFFDLPQPTVWLLSGFALIGLGIVLRTFLS